ncbi:MAG: CHAT domain-containing protein [Acidimicrobiales bacterium]
MIESRAVAHFARVVAELARRESQCEDLCEIATQVGRSGFYVVDAELELLKDLLHQVRRANKHIVALGIVPPEDGEQGDDLDQIETLLSSGRWALAEEIQKAFEARCDELDLCATDLGLWLGQAIERADKLDRLVKRAEAGGVPRNCLAVERDAAERLLQSLRSAEEALKDGQLSEAYALKERIAPSGGEEAPGMPADGKPPAELRLADVEALAGEVERKTADAEEMTRPVEVLLLQGALGDGMREYNIVLRTPSAPGSQGVSVHDVVEVVEEDRRRAEQAVGRVTGAVAVAQSRGSRDLSGATAGVDEATSTPVSERLRDLGDLLYRVFVPPFARFLLAESKCPIAMTTNDVVLPWELLHDGTEFVSLQRPLARMPAGHAIPRRPRRQDERRRLRFLLTYANPIGDLPEVEREIHYIEEALKAEWEGQIEVEVEERPTGTFLNDALRKGRYDVIHFAGHAAFEERRAGGQARAGLVLHSEVGDDRRTELFPASKIEGFVEGRPVVFLNACSTGRSAADDRSAGVSYDAQPAAGLASAFLYGGALACIGSLWPVYDVSARSFAVAFYKAIIQRESIGGAMLKARLDTHAQFPHDATWASFVLFGNPTFRLDMSMEAAASAARA